SSDAGSRLDRHRAFALSAVRYRRDDDCRPHAFRERPRPAHRSLVTTRVSTTRESPVVGIAQGPFAWGPVLSIAGGSVLVLGVLGSRYGYHRDELYFLAASRHLALGYVDQPPVAVLVAWLNRVAFGNTLVGLRVVPALVIGAVVAITGLIARELGSSRFAQGFAAGCVASSALLVVGHLEGPTVYDALTWVLVSWLVVRVLRTGDDRLLVAVR